MEVPTRKEMTCKVTITDDDTQAFCGRCDAKVSSSVQVVEYLELTMCAECLGNLCGMIVSEQIKKAFRKLIGE